MDHHREKVVFSANRGFGLTRSRSELIKRCMDSGYTVIAAVKEDSSTYKLRELGAEVEAVEYERGGLSVWKDLRALLRLLRLYSDVRPVLVHHYHTKPVLLGTFAAWLTGGIKVVNTLTGLGYAFSRSVMIRFLATLGYRVLLRQADITVFQNPDDRELFVQKKLVPLDKSEVIISAGVDTDRFLPPSGSRQPGSRVLMISRLLWQKGVREFMKAAEAVQNERPDVTFLLGGELDEEHPNGIDKQWILDQAIHHNVDYIGYVEDMVGLMQSVDLFVLPSYYREGVPRVLLEANACGVPVITTDAPGCREAVIHGKTGFLVPPRDSQALGEAIKSILNDPERKREMGFAARSLAEEAFDKDKIIRAYLSVYEGLGLKIDRDV